MIQFPAIMTKTWNWFRGRHTFWLILYELFFAVLLIRSYTLIGLTVLRVELLYLALFAFPSLLFLMIIEKRADKPFPFLSAMSGKSMLINIPASIIAPIVLTPLIDAVWFHTSISWPVPLQWVALSSLILNLHVAITEESIKIASINAIAWRTRNARTSKRRPVLFVAIVLSVGVWAYSHIFFAGFDNEQILITFVMGLVWELLVYKFRNYLPSIAGHFYWNVTFFT